MGNKHRKRYRIEKEKLNQTYGYKNGREKGGEGRGDSKHEKQKTKHYSNQSIRSQINFYYNIVKQNIQKQNLFKTITNNKFYSNTETDKSLRVRSCDKVTIGSVVAWL